MSAWLPTLLAPANALLALLALPLVAVYFLKLRRPSYLVPSTALWRLVTDDQRVNSPFQRFKRHLLLWLQLLALLLLVLAALMPLVKADQERVLRRPVFVDASASMAALDAPGGQSRLDHAKREVARLIDDLGPGQELCLVSFAQRARSHGGFTANKRLLLAALEEIAVEDVESDLEEAMRFAQALSRAASFDEVLLVSDGNLPERVGLDLAFALRYQLVPKAGANVGITAVGARRGRDGGWVVYVELAGSGAALAAGGATGLVTVADANGAELASEALALGEGGHQRLLFALNAAASGLVVVRYAPVGFDSLASDDVCYLALPPPRDLRVRVAPGLVAFHHALATVSEIVVNPTTPGADDLVITDSLADLDRPARVALSVGLVPPAAAPLIEVGPGADEVADWERRSELLQHVQLSELVIMDQPRWLGTGREAALETAGFEVLVHGRKGPLAIARRGGPPVYHLLFHPDRSTLPYRVAFPILVANLALQARRLAGLSEASGTRTGSLAPVPMAPRARFVVDGPPGVPVQEGTASEDGVATGVHAARAGVYVVRPEGGEARKIGAGLLSAAETRLERVEELAFKEALAVAAREDEVSTDRPLWRILALVALVALCVEWWVFNVGPGLGSGAR